MLASLVLVDDPHVLRHARNAFLVHDVQRVVARNGLYRKPRRNHPQIAAIPSERELDQTNVGTVAVRGAARLVQRYDLDALAFCQLDADVEVVSKVDFFRRAVRSVLGLYSSGTVWKIKLSENAVSTVSVPSVLG